MLSLNLVKNNCMRIKELIKEECFSKIVKEVNEFCGDMLDEYLINLNTNEDKQIFDLIWGPIEFNAGEVAIIDSPLFQRLRRIKHLGLVSYVYCNADYSRFSHTIGVFFIANKMASIIRKVDKNQKNDFDYIQVTRLAALFHDVGHMYYSHISEYYFSEDITFSRHNEMKDLIIRFSEVANKKIALHEIMSILILNSQSVRDLLKKVSNSLMGIKFKDEKSYDKLIEYMCCQIMGISNDRYLLPYHQIINGSVDADKCDYLSRDSYSTKVPVAVDIERLVYKLSVTETSEHRQDNELWDDESKNDKFYYPVLKSSAQEALNQLLISRSIMFKSVYYHQKVRTAETMLKEIISDLSKMKLKEVENFRYILGTTDDFFITQCITSLENQPNIKNDCKDLIRDIERKLRRLNNRILLKRVCSISKENLLCDDSKWFDISKEVFQLNKPDKINIIIEKTKNEFEYICELLNIEVEKNLIFSISEFPKYIPDNSKIDTFICYGNGELIKASEVFQSETWMSSKENRNKEHYLLTNASRRDLAFIALQVAIYKLYGVKLKDDSSIYSKVNINEIRTSQKDLYKKNYYNEYMIIISEIIMLDFSNQLQYLTKKFRTYEGKGGYTISEITIETFLLQFLDYKVDEYKHMKMILDGVIRLISNTEVIDRAAFDLIMGELLARVKSSNSIKVCPIGNGKDSAKHLMYYFNDIEVEGCKVEIIESLHEYLKLKDKNIIFFDDGAYSGKQIVSVFQEYFGIKDRSTSENHVIKLNKIEQCKLKKANITILYLYFNNDNNQYILSELSKLGLNNVKIDFYKNMNTKIFANVSVFQNQNQIELLKKCLNEIGYQTLFSKKCIDGIYKENWNELRIKESTLGYNDSQQMVVLKSSIPTYSITAFWIENGLYNFKKWIPLFMRTDK